MPHNFITLPRSQLYELVWTRPVRDLAAEFGISDVALAKRCRALKIPVPGRGHWAKVAAGQTPKRSRLLGFHDPRAKQARGAVSQRERPHPLGGTASPSLPSYASVSAGEEPVISFAPAPQPPPPPAPDSPISPEEAALRARIDALELTPLDTLLHAHPAVLRTAVQLKHLKSRDITWPRGTRSGPILTVTNVSDAQMARALRVLDAVLRASAALGWPFTAPPPQEPPTYRGRGSWGPTPAAPPVLGSPPRRRRTAATQDRRTPSAVRPRAHRDRTRRPEGRPPRLDAALRLRAVRRTAPAPLRRRQPLGAQNLEGHQSTPAQDQASKILHGLLDRALELKRDREEQRLRDIAQREHERQEALVRQRRASHAKLIHELECEAGAWHRAQFLRRYLRAARRTLGTDAYLVKVDDREVDFLAWAEHYVNQLDPLHPEARDPDFAHERTFQYGADDKRLQEELQRLSGHAWERAQKMIAHPKNNGSAHHECAADR